MADTHSNTIRFADRVTNSASFTSLYAEGMGLVEETANYLDGEGRSSAKSLPRMASVLYAAESMRLTTRLMQMASWLLLQRAVNNGEMTHEQVIAEKSKVRLDGFVCDQSAPGWNDLPEKFRELVQHSLRLQSRISILDREIYRRKDQTIAEPNRVEDNSVKAQQSLLKTAFGSD